MKKSNSWELQLKELEKLKKKDLIGYIYLMSLAAETKPYIIMHPSIDSKQKIEIIIDRSVSRLQILSLFTRRYFKVITELLKTL